MRTTIEMSAEHRSALLSIAARRGEKGFSAIVEEAIDVYLDGERERFHRAEALRSLAGALDEADANELRRKTECLRGTWR